MNRTICLYLQVHQPYRLRPYSVFDTANSSDYWGNASLNEQMLRKIANTSYRPTNAMLLQLLRRHPTFSLSLSLTGTVVEQLQAWAPDVIDDFKKLVATGRVEILSETYYHSLAYFYSLPEFERQVQQHRELMQTVFGVKPKVFRNTELSYNNSLAQWAEHAGYDGIITEGWDPILGWRSPNFMYRPAYTKNIRLLLKNYKLSDDIAFRFSEHSWAEWPLTADKYLQWLQTLPPDQPLINLFMDYETFGEHQWRSDGIFDFFTHFTDAFLQQRGNSFATISKAIAAQPPVAEIDIPTTITWADNARDLTAWVGNAMQNEAIQNLDVLRDLTTWVGNAMQNEAIQNLYALEKEVLATKNDSLIQDWRRLQTSDHFYYMCTKWFNDGDVHAYFNPHQSPYDAFIYFCNVLRDITLRLSELKGVR